MSLRLILEHGPVPQQRQEIALEGGAVTIGRDADCDWQIDDPQMYVSRRHCVILAGPGGAQVTDESSGGTYLDSAERPLGRGTTATLSPGSRLRLGDFHFRVVPRQAEDAPAHTPGTDPADSFFTARPAAIPEPPVPRPAHLPRPFDTPPPSPGPDRAAPLRAGFDDPFTLDTGPSATPAAAPAPFDLSPGPSRVRVAGVARAEPAVDPAFDDFAVFGLPAPAAPVPPPDQNVPSHDPQRADPDPFPAPASHRTPTTEGPPAFDAFFRGLGLAPPPGFTGSAQEMEALGRRYRALTEGLVALLRARTREKGMARVAQTTIGALEVNPLKFLVTAEETLSALIVARGAGYLDPDRAIAESFRDLHDHQRRNWSGLQGALRQMIDRFDPAQFEAEVEEVGMIRSLVVGSRSAKLWQLYSERYRDMARAAEERFLGDLGADFRTAYETDRSGSDDRQT